MTAKTVSAKVTTASEPTYTELLRRVRQLFATDVETRFEIAVIFGKMLKHKSAVEIADDTDMTPGGIERIARVAEFWGNVRIKPDGAGKRPAPWFVYDRVALDPIIPPEKKELIRRAAPTKGLTVVRQMITDARRPEVARLEDIVRSKRAAKQTTPRPAGRKARARRLTDDVVIVSGEDGTQFLQHALLALDEAINELDKLESLSEEDAAIVQAKVDALAKQYVRLTRV